MKKKRKLPLPDVIFVVVGDDDPSLSLEDVSMVTDNWGSGAGCSCFTFK